MAGGGTNREDGDVGFPQIAPMVDVVLVLLLFFMAAAAPSVIPRELTIPYLPSGAGATFKPGPSPTPSSSISRRKDSSPAARLLTIRAAKSFPPCATS